MASSNVSLCATYAIVWEVFEVGVSCKTCRISVKEDGSHPETKLCLVVQVKLRWQSFSSLNQTLKSLNSHESIIPNIKPLTGEVNYTDLSLYNVLGNLAFWWYSLTRTIHLDIIAE